MEDDNLTQVEINRREWRDPDNWSGPKWLSIYFSKKDSRTWVPKQIPSMGWTVNLGTKAGIWWLFGVFIGIPLLGVIIVFIAIAAGK